MSGADQHETAGSARIQGELWGTRARDWAEVQEPVSRPLYEAVLTRAGVGPGLAVLDIGCGAGLFCGLAAARGARVSGLDASGALVAIAKARVPQGDFRVGEMEALPYGDHVFGLVTGFNSFQFAATPLAALREARRVARPAGSVVIATWGRPEDTEAAAYLEALRSLLPPPPPGTPGPFALSGEGALASVVRSAGLTPGPVGQVECPLEYPDLATALRGLLAAGPAVRAIQVAGEDRVRDAVIRAIAPYRLSSGGYRLEHSFLFMIATAPA